MRRLSNRACRAVTHFWRTELLAAAVVFALAVSPCFAGVVYDLQSDWSNSSNPNGVWTYQGGSVPLPSNVSNWGGITGQNAWAPSATTPPGFLPAWMQVSSALLSTVNDGTAVGNIVTHTYDSGNGAPGYGQSNVIWTAPSAGVADINGFLWQARNLAGRNQQWTLFIDGVSTATDSFTGGTSTPYTASNPDRFSDAAVPIFAGEVIEMQVATTSFSGDFVGVSETINFTPAAVPEPSSLALVGIVAVAACCWWRWRGKNKGVRILSHSPRSPVSLGAPSAEAYFPGPA